MVNEVEVSIGGGVGVGGVGVVGIIITPVLSKLV